jgi:hypothetical protein
VRLVRTEPWVMLRWKYATLEVVRVGSALELRLVRDGLVLPLAFGADVTLALRTLAADGWELVSMKSVASGDRYVLKSKLDRA